MMRQFHFRLLGLLLSTALALGLLSLPARAGGFEDAQRAYDRGDYATTWNLLIKLQSDPRAIYVLGLMAEYGIGRPVDPALAARFYEKAQHTGHPVSLDRLDSGALEQALLAAIIRVKSRLDGPNQASDQLLAAARNNLAYLWAEQNGLLQEALCLSGEAKEFYPKVAAIVDTYGFVLFHLKRFDEAEKFFDKAQQIEPNSIHLEHLGDVAHVRGRDGDAKNLWKQALGLAKTSQDVARLTRKRNGHPDDFGAGRPFKLENYGLSKDCNRPAD
jgi:tetratricopeptide (TPR) repeat protein